MKTFLYLTFLCAMSAQAQYSSRWSAFDAGMATHQAGVVTHAGVAGGLCSGVQQSANYENQQRSALLPMAVQTPGLPRLTITRIGSSVRIAWPKSATGVTLQASTSLNPIASTSDWRDVLVRYQQDEDESFVVLSAAQAAEFFRLRSQ